MTDALSQSGYQIQHCGVGDPSGREPTGNRIRAAIRTTLHQVQPGSVVIVYFSGHGVVVDGRSWLVPQDAYAVGDNPDPDSLVSLVPLDLGDCAARLVLFVVDACRNDLSDSLITAAGSGSLPYPPDGAFVLINSCQPGERSQYGDDGSYFTQALAEVLDRRYHARTLDEVYDAVIRQLARKAARTDGLEQHPDFVHAQRGLSRAELGTTVICEGDSVGEAWRRAVESTPIWDRADGQASQTDRIRRAVLGVVDACAQTWLGARAALKEQADIVDPWSAQDYPVRVLAALDKCLPQDVELTPFELAAAVSTPFLREVALSAGLRLAAGVRPQNFSRTFQDGARSDLEITHAMHEHVCRRAEGLERRGHIETRDALAMWLVHRWLAGRSSLWDDPVLKSLTARIAAAVAPISADPAEREMNTALSVLIQCVDADVEDHRLTDRLNTHVFDSRARTLGGVLWLAGIMAADPRRMPGVVVDHLGIGAELPIPRLHAATVQASWRQTSNEMLLQAVCDHPALYAAFRELVQRAEDARSHLASFPLDSALASSLPARFSAARVRAEISDGAPAFDTPLLQFRLSDDKVRELLMGRQLYGEPDLAIRELYQNALDACRYRRTRREYQSRTHQPVTAWDGTIELQQGVDENGREFIECVDNGVGMSREILMSTFANAGERFVYRPTFRAEQALWQELNPPLRLIPNSQFGVGVFSYFMIAEEILIATRHVNENDVVDAHAHSVRIASSGSLFRITTSTDMPGGGTRVRLYLTGEDPISVLRTMRRLLLVAEFQVTVSQADGTREVWYSERLRYPGATVEPLKFGDDLWWVPGKGGIAADGLRTNEEQHGLIVNLRGPRRPQFTVDRNKLRSWDREWITWQVHASLTELQEWPGLKLSWLWQVTDKAPRIAEEIFQWLVGNDRTIPMGAFWAHNEPVPVARVGCLPVDQQLLNGELWWSSFAETSMWLVSWRVGVWKGTLSFIGIDGVPEVECLDGFPIVGPLDASVIDRVYEICNRYSSPSRYGCLSVDDLLRVAADEEESPIARFRRLRRYAITGLDLTALRRLPPIQHVFRKQDGPPQVGVEDEAILPALAAWAPPGEPPKQAIGGWLGYTSASLHAPLGEVLRRAAALVPAGWVGPSHEDLGDLCDQVLTWDDVTLFSRQQTQNGPWINTIVSPAHIMQLSGELGREVGEILGLFDRYAPLGYEVAGRTSYPSEFSRVEREALRFVYEMGFQLSSLHLLVLAGRTNVIVREVRAGLETLASLGFLRLPAKDPFPDAMPTEAERTVINESLVGYDESLDVTRLAAGWFAVTCVIQEIGPQEQAGFDDRLAHCERLLKIVDIGRPVTMAEIIDLAYWLDYSVGASVDLYARLYPDTADLSALPPEAIGSSAQCHRYEERMAVLTEPRKRWYGNGEVAWTATVGDIVRGAAMSRQSITAFLAALEPLQKIGAPLPVLSEADQKLLGDRPADRYDVAMLNTTDDQGQLTTIERVGPLWLVQVAGRFGWTVAEARRRMARLEPLGLVVNCRPQDCPDEIVCWQDLLALSVHLDGQEPTLSGSVEVSQLAAAADEIGETIPMVSSRLRKYANLFGFSVEQAATGTEEPDDV
jgi:hypothetical protein